MEVTDAAGDLLLSFKEGTVLREPISGPPVLESLPLILSLDGAPEVVLAAARALLAAKTTVAELSEELGSAGDSLAATSLVEALGAWDGLGLLCRTVPLPVGQLATIVPISPDFEFRVPAPTLDTTYLLSRFVYCRRVVREMCVESPRSRARVVLHDWRAQGAFHHLAAGATLEDLREAHDDLPASALSLFVSLLIAAGMLTEVGDDGPVEEGNATLRQWAFHDLLFHSRNRRGRHAEPYGKTEPFRGEIPPCPALKPAMSERVVRLSVPRMDELAASDLPLAAAMESRTSTRAFGRQPLKIAQLAEFLYRTARSEPVISASSRSYEIDRRPYPSGGSCHELELYVVCGACEGLAPGLYHYHPREHALFGLRGLDAPVIQLLEDAGRSTGVQVAGSEPRVQVLIILAARFQRVAWAYESIAYSLIQKHVGVMYQSMYLVATAMGLGACALGGGDADAFARATGLDDCVEGSVGEFLLGSL